MPKQKLSQSAKLKNIVKEYSEFKTDGTVLLCTVCNKSVSSDRIFFVKQHIASVKHIQLKERHANKDKTQVFLLESESQFSKDILFQQKLCEAFVSADIPLYKLRNENIKNLFETFTNYKVPCESTLRSKHINRLYVNCIENIKKALKNQYIWISIDETLDAKGRNIANVIVGILSSNEETAKKKFLLNTAILKKTNHSSIATLFDDSIKILDVNFNKDMILLFVTDAAPYMVKAAKAIKTFYPKITHVTCFAHGLHRVCEAIRNHYENVDKIISNVKKVFLKAPCRVEIFKEIYPELSLPPEPITTRWGTWLEAVNYYAINSENILNVLDNLKDDAQSIKNAKEALRKSTTKTDLVFIASNYGFIANHIKKLQTSAISLNEQIKILNDTIKNIDNVPDCNAKYTVQNKIKQIVEKNRGLETLQNICGQLNGSKVTPTTEYNVSEVLAFKYAPMNSADVERSFSFYKNIFRSNRQNFLFENLCQYVVIYCNYNMNSP